MTYKLDEKDWSILEALKENARMSIREIAKKTGTRPSTVHNRMGKLEQAGVIEQYTVKINDEAIGEDFVVFMLVSGNMERYIDDQFVHLKTVKEIYGVTGEYDMLLKLKFGNINDFNRFIIDFREKFAGQIIKTLTMIKTVKLKG